MEEGLPGAGARTDKIRILIVDDHPVIGHGLKLVLEQDPEMLVLGTAETGEKGLEYLRKWHPDVVILDLEMPHFSGCQLVRLVREAQPRVHILIFSLHDDEKYVRQALQAGAHGYVVKGSSMQNLLQAIHYVRDGGYWVSPQFSRCLVRSYVKEEPDDPEANEEFDGLSERLKEVFMLMVDGKDTEQIADLLCISVNTVAKHRTILMAKLGLKNVVEMTRYAIRKGLIEP